MSKTRLIFKFIYNFISIIIAVPFVLLYRFFCIFFYNNTVFKEFSQFISIVPCFLGKMLRRGFYYIVLKKCSISFNMDYGSFLSSLNVTVGNNVYVGSYTILSSCNIGDDVLIGSGVYVVNKKAHSFDDSTKLIRTQNRIEMCVNIGNDCWIGNSVVVMDDIGSHSVVGAGSVVVTKIESYSVAVGNPAQVVKQR